MGGQAWGQTIWYKKQGGQAKRRGARPPGPPHATGLPLIIDVRALESFSSVEHWLLGFYDSTRDKDDT